VPALPPAALPELPPVIALPPEEGGGSATSAEQAMNAHEPTSAPRPKTPRFDKANPDRFCAVLMLKHSLILVARLPSGTEATNRTTVARRRNDIVRHPKAGDTQRNHPR
jgi:hypothetical protein